MQIYILPNVTKFLGAQKPSNWHISPNCWHDISNTNIYKYNWHVFLKSEYKYKYHKIYICIGYILPKIRKIYVSWRVSVNPLGAGLGNVNFVLDINCQHVGNIIQLKLYIKGWVFAVWAQGSLMYIFFIIIFVLEISCQHLGYTCQLNSYTGIGYILPTIGGYMSVGGFLPQGPTVRGPTVHPEKVDSWAMGQKPSNWHISSNSWQDISNTSI